MGRWGYHPMESDDSLDSIGRFFIRLEDQKRKELSNEELDFSDITDDTVVEYLNGITKDEVVSISEKEMKNEDLFVIPYIFNDYDIKREDLKNIFLKFLDSYKSLENYSKCVEVLLEEKKKFEKTSSLSEHKTLFEAIFS